MLEAWNFGFKKKRNCTICEATTLVLISFAVTGKLICTIVFAYAGCKFSDVAAQILYSLRSRNQNFTPIE